MRMRVAHRDNQNCCRHTGIVLLNLGRFIPVSTDQIQLQRLADMIEHNCQLACRFAELLKHGGCRISNDVFSNQVLVSSGDAAQEVRNNSKLLFHKLHFGYPKRFKLVLPLLQRSIIGLLSNPYIAQCRRFVKQTDWPLEGN